MLYVSIYLLIILLDVVIFFPLLLKRDTVPGRILFAIMIFFDSSSSETRTVIASG
jgi:hypothetical protein